MSATYDKKDLIKETFKVEFTIFIATIIWKKNKKLLREFTFHEKLFSKPNMKSLTIINSIIS